MKKNETGNILIVAAVLGALAAGAAFFAYQTFGPKNIDRNFSLPKESNFPAGNANTEVATSTNDNPGDENPELEGYVAEPEIEFEGSTDPDQVATTAAENPKTTDDSNEFIEYEVGTDSTAAATAANAFGMDLYAKYRAKSDNIFFSPYSIFSALEMTYEGAKGKTASEIASVFHFSADGQTRVGSFANLYRQINSQNATYQLSAANALWAQKSYPFRSNYLKTVETYYGGKAMNADFAGDAEGSRQMINQWVSSKTNDKIPELFAEGTIDELTRLVLTNAVYFKGKWATPFDKELTQEKDFETAAQTNVKAQMMEQAHRFLYSETNEYQAVEIPYENNDLSMVLVLPKEGKMETAETAIMANGIAQIRRAMSSEEVRLSLPKFKFDTSYNMNKSLAEMGMPAAFDPDKADFTGMYDRGAARAANLYIDLVIHKAYVDVNEEGTEAAAATGVEISRTTSIMQPEEPKIFNANHPFMFAITHNQTGTVLFMGKVNDPIK